MRVFVYYDVSGSIPTHILAEYRAEGAKRREKFEHSEWLEFAFSHTVEPFEEYLSGSYRCASGGTDSKAVYDHWCANAKPEDAFLMFTDGYMPSMPIPPGYGPAALIIHSDGGTYGETAPLRAGRESEEWAGIDNE